MTKSGKNRVLVSSRNGSPSNKTKRYELLGKLPTNPILYHFAALQEPAIPKHKTSLTWGSYPPIPRVAGCATPGASAGENTAASQRRGKPGKKLPLRTRWIFAAPLESAKILSPTSPTGFPKDGLEGKRMVSSFIGNEVPRKGLRVRVPCPPLEQKTHLQTFESGSFCTYFSTVSIRMTR
jgi:hypothetical protein